MKGRLVLLAVYFTIVPLFFLALIIYQSFLYHQNSHNSARVIGANAQAGVEYLSLPQDIPDTHTALDEREARIEVLNEFFSRYDSPLKDYSEKIVDAADKYGLDYRLLPAIAMQESTLCLKAPKGLNNCWGFGIYGKKKTGFSDYGVAIETVSKTLAKDYHGQGLIEPIDIMSKYTPSNEGEWAENVSYVMDRIASSL